MMITEFDLSSVYLCVGGKNSHCSFHGDGFSGTGLSYDSNGFPFIKVNINSPDSMYRSCGGLEGNIKIGYRKNLFFVFRHVLVPHISFIFGSNASLNPSATRLKLNIKSAITMIGGMIW